MTSPFAPSRQNPLWITTAAVLLLVVLTVRATAASEAQEQKSSGKVAVAAKDASEPPKSQGDESSLTRKQGTGTTKVWTLPDGTKMYSGKGITITGVGGSRLDEIGKLITAKSYTFLSTFDSLDGQTQYVYRFNFADGTDTAMNFSMPLDDVTSWEDYEKKQEKQQEQRQEKIKEAIAAGRFRLLNVEPMLNHICRDVATGEKFKVQRIARPDGQDVSFPRADYGPIPSTVKEKKWTEHLQAIRDGKRELLEAESINNYTYELTSDDGKRLLFNYGGGEPLKKPGEQSSVESLQPSAGQHGR